MTAGAASASQTPGEGTEVARALLCFLVLFVQGAARHSPGKNNPRAQRGCGTAGCAACSGAVLASDLLGDKGLCLMGIFPTSPNLLLSDFAPLGGVFLGEPDKLLLQ